VLRGGFVWGCMICWLVLVSERLETVLVFLSHAQLLSRNTGRFRISEEVLFLRSWVLFLGKALFVLLLACIADDTPRTYYGLEMMFWIL
jgi:hypothetical protein